MINSQEKIYLTERGFEKLKRDYEKLLEIRKQGEGDSESLTLINQRLEELDLISKTYELIKPPPKSKQKFVNLGATVVVQIDDQEDEFTIVGTLEANPSLGRISNESPVGQALLNKRVGEEVVISSTIKTIYKIKEIRYEL